MSGVERGKLRIKSNSEVFSPTFLVQEILDQLPKELFKNETKTIFDPTCGDGQFLSEALIRKLENNIEFETALSTIYGMDIMPDNVKLTQDRLLCGYEEFRPIVEKNITVGDALELGKVKQPSLF